jgi:hypothetical protein
LGWFVVSRFPPLAVISYRVTQHTSIEVLIRESHSIEV